jgi:hypothetical protein
MSLFRVLMLSGAALVLRKFEMPVQAFPKLQPYAQQACLHRTHGNI